jgi:hypothetical protein
MPREPVLIVHVAALDTTTSTDGVLSGRNDSGLSSRDKVGSNDGSSSALANLALDKACANPVSADRVFPALVCPNRIAKSHVENGAVNGERHKTRRAAAQILVGIALSHRQAA